MWTMILRGWLDDCGLVAQTCALPDVSVERGFSEAELLLLQLWRGITHRGSEVRLTTGEPMRPSQFPRPSIDPPGWQWRTLVRAQWREHAHINELEAHAALMALQWRCRDARRFGKRGLILLGSFVSIGVLTNAVSYFAQWALTMTGHLADSWDELDLQVMAYMETLWDESDNETFADNTLNGIQHLLLAYMETLLEKGDSKTFAANTWNGIQHLLCARRVLPGGWKLLRTWDKGCDLTAVVKVSTTKRQRGVCHHRRPECWTTTGGDYKIPSSRCFAARGTSTVFRQFFARALRELKVERHDFRPYSVRRGGTLFDLAIYGDIKRTMARGTWGG
jgi:hypothetical protein